MATARSSARDADDLCWLPATELAALIRRRKVSPVDVVNKPGLASGCIAPSSIHFAIAPADSYAEASMRYAPVAFCVTPFFNSTPPSGFKP